MGRERGTGLDRPWKRPGAGRYALSRLHGLLYPPVTVCDRPDDLVMDLDVPVTTRDGTVLEVNVHRPPGAGQFPVLVCAQVHGKDRLPNRKRGYGYAVDSGYRTRRQPGPIRFSRLTSWAAPDPGWWVAHGYAVVNVDLRGTGASGGTGNPLSEQEGEDVYDLVQWAGAQTWSTGAVALAGASYLALAQWKAAALRPPALRAIMPWDGFADVLRGRIRRGRSRVPVENWWHTLESDLAAIEVPALICAGFGGPHRGSIEAFSHLESTPAHLWTHRGGTWPTFYGDDALAAQLQFLDQHLRGRAQPLPRVRLEVRQSRDDIVEVRSESAWPLTQAVPTPLYLTADGLASEPATEPGSIGFAARRHGARFDWIVPADVEITGAMALRVFLSLRGSTEVFLTAGVEKWRAGRYVPFEGANGFGRDRVATGGQHVSTRAGGAVIALEIGLSESATLFRAGETLRLVLAARPLWPRNPLTGQPPANSGTRPRGTCLLHWGAGRDAQLLVPVIG